MNFEELYSKTNDNLKLKFLNAIIRKNSALQNEFEHFIQSEKNVSEVVPTSSFMEILTSTKKKYQDDFEMVDTENPDWENYHAPHSGYIEDWEAYQQASEQEFEEIFEAFSSEAVDKIIGQKPDELIAMLTGLYEATQDAEIEDEVSSFEDINDYLLSEFQSTMNSIIENTSEWLHSAKQFYLSNTEVAKQLLQYYFDADKDSFVQTADELFKSDKRFWAKFLKDYVSVDEMRKVGLVK